MDLPISTSLEQFLEAFREYSDASSDEIGFSVNELAEAFDRSPEWVRRKLRMLQQRGMLKTSFKFSSSIDGRRIRVPIYILIQGDDAND